MKCYRGCILVLCLLLAMFTATVATAQETTGGLQGTVKDATGAVVPGAQVTVTGPSLVGSKKANTDASGYYHFANLPPGTYTLTVTQKGFNTVKRDGIVIEIGHLPSLDLELQVGAAETVLEVSSETPVIDVTTTRTMTNVNQEVIADVPHGRSFQSVIQFAPSARNEPLAGQPGGTGGSLPGSSGNGLGFGYSVGGAADSENSYLIEGQDTENISGGFSKANVPFEFIQEVQIKTSGIEAEHGGALGGVVNVVMKKGGNQWHGQLFTTYEGDHLDGNNNGAFLQYDPNGNSSGPTGLIDPAVQLYAPKKDHFTIVQTGATVGGAIVKDKLWFFAGFAPQYNSQARTVDFQDQSGNAGLQNFTRDEQQYYATGRLDYAPTQKLRLFGSWLYQYSRESGAHLPTADATDPNFINVGIFQPLSAYSHGIGWSAPNSTYNLGADITVNPKIVLTSRFGYFFENYHDFGWPTQSPDLVWSTPADATTKDNLGNPLPSNLFNSGGFSTQPFNASNTLVNSNKHYQFNQDMALFKSGWLGTHNFKFGYQLNHLVNVIDQNGNVPQAFLILGQHSHRPATTTGAANCALLAAKYGRCAGQFGFLVVQDFATILDTPASDWNHAFFAQDAWTIGKGLTINAGIRIEKESLPAPNGVQIQAIDFGWGDKIAPRVGAAWDVFRNGKMKLFGSYGVVNDVMKLLLAQSSFGAQAFEQCSYALGPNGNASGFNISDIDLSFVNNRACPNGLPTVGANFKSGNTPTGLQDGLSGVSLIENVNLRPREPVAPGVKPYRQHEFNFGWDYQVSRNWAFEARYDRRRLDHVIEDASLSDPNNFEIFSIVNPGEGVNRTIDGYANFLRSLGQAFGVPGVAFDADPTTPFGTCPTCPAMAKPVRSYDGVEFRLTKAISNRWSGMIAYTYSRLYGNYTGLTTTDQSDGGTTGRNSPDTTRAFDEPYYNFGANGKSNDGLLPTDRPNTFKGYAYYQLPWGKKMTSTFGIFQAAYQGSPVSSYMDLGLGSPGAPIEAVYPFGRGKFVDVTTDAAGNITALGNPTNRRTPWFTQTDFNFAHEIKVNHNNEAQILGFEVNVTNVLNQHSVTSYYEGINSTFQGSAAFPNGVTVFDGANAYKQFETGYSVLPALAGVSKSSWYGQPASFQLARNIRFKLRFTF